MKRALLSVLILASALSAQTPEIRNSDEITDSIKAAILVDAAGYDWLEEVCRIGPRLSGSKELELAIDWAEKKMISLGFDSVWRQPVMVPHWERGSIEEAHIVEGEYNGRKLSIASLGSSIGTDPVKGLTAEVIEISSFDELKQRRSEVEGKIVFFNVHFNQSYTNTFRAYGDCARYRVFGAREAAYYGAEGVLIRSITSQYDNVPHVGVMYYADTVHKIPAAAIGLEDADLLSALLKDGNSVTINMKMDCRTNPDVESSNLIGEIKGAEYPNEVIVIGGHYDSWDKGDGAHDDAAGCIQSMEVVEIFKRLDIKPKRTIRCVFFANEENGLRGALKYGEYSDTADVYHIAAIESDRGAYVPRGFSVDADSSVIAKFNTWLPLLKKAKIDWVEAGGSGGDVRQIKRAGAYIGYIPDNSRYFDLHHSANDVISEVNPREFELGTAAMAILVYMISEYGIE